MTKPLLRALLLVVTLLSTLGVVGQKPVELKGNPPAAAAPDDQDTLSIRSFSRMVLVDIVAKDSHGSPIPGLTANDFELLEDGQPQRIVSFNHNSSELLPAMNPMTAPAANEIVSNHESGTAPPSIIVLDLLNTASKDRSTAQQALGKYVKEQMRRGELMAVFVLGTRLELLRDFTRDEREVQDAVGLSQRALADPEAKAEGADALFFAAALDPLGMNAGITLAEKMLRNENEAGAQRTITRVNRTMEALRSLARFGARHQGRKSLVWLSAGFPFFILTDMGVTGFETELRQTTNLLASTQIAVYPVDVRGLVEVKGREIEDRLQQRQLMNPNEKADRLTARSDGGEHQDEGLTPHSYLEANFNFNQSQDTMKEVADLTGGTAYMNRNDIDVAIAQALDDNRDTYTLGYYPLKKDFNNRFRRIKVRLKNREASLRYRKGYYATGFSVEGKVNTDLIYALENDPTVSPQIPLISRVDPNAPLANTPFKVELFVKGGHIHYTDVSAKSAAFLDFAVVALSPDGTPIARTFRRGELKFNKDGLARAERAGFTYSLPVNLPAGEYRIRAGIRDSFTGRIGTVEIPVVVK